MKTSEFPRSLSLPWIILGLALLPGPNVRAGQPLALPIAPGPFQPTLESLTNYHCPEWFRDAKFGIWAHWGPQAVPMDGDWYARGMYEEGNGHYRYHLAHYGHPSTNGYKDIIPSWRAEKWDPDRLMALYKQAGARYFVSMASHHDNFYLWNSKLHRWNAVNMGPKRDVVGDWQQAALKQGLRFGVSEHLGASFTWFQSSHRADKTGPFAGVPYDGADPRYQDLYHFPAEPDDTGWYSTNPRWQQQWFDRIKELVDGYHPDLLYTDGGVPFGNEVGRSMIAHLYNSDAARRGGAAEAVYTCKQQSDGRWIEDLERGVMARINPNPWQTDTSIGDWYYNRNWKFRPVSWTLHMLVDIVSKNGNLLLNIVQRPDGSLDPEVEQALHDLATWIAVNGEAIYGTRPWLTYGEGPVKARGGHFKEDFSYTAQDIRFTTKGDTLFAFALGWPAEGRLLVRSLAHPGGSDEGAVRRVRLLGHRGPLSWTQTTNGLEVVLPDQKPCEHAFALEIAGSNLKPAPVTEVGFVVKPNARGAFVFPAAEADLHGDGVGQETRGGETNLGFWDRAGDWVSWTAQFSKAGRFKLSAACATVNNRSELTLNIAGQTLPATIESTGDWAQFRTTELGSVEIASPGPQTLEVRPRSPQTWKAVNLRWIKFEPAD